MLNVIWTGLEIQTLEFYLYVWNINLTDHVSQNAYFINFVGLFVVIANFRLNIIGFFG